MRSTRRTRRSWPARLLLAMATTLLLSLPVTSCCGHCPKSKAQTVFVEKAQIKKSEQPGWWAVTDGWLADRLAYEQALQKALDACEREIDD